MFVFRDVESNVIALREKVFQTDQPGTDTRGGFFGKNRVEGENFALETAKAFGNQLADGAEADDTDGFTGNFPAHEFGLFPFTSAGGSIGGNQMTGISEHERNDLFSNGIGISAGSIHHIDFALPRIFRVDRVVPCTGTDNHLESRQCIDQFRGYLLAANNKCIGVGMLCRKSHKLSLSVLYNGITPVSLKKLLGNCVEFGWNQYFFHSFLHIKSE